MEVGQMKAKYYTPSIEEFHVGFEYEIHNDPRTDDGWDKEVVESRDWNKMYCIKEDNDVDYRVKYLDKEDIVSLGFELTQNLADDFEFEWHIRNEIGQYIGIFTDEYDLSKETNIELFDIHFKIKNKSELIVLLKQLGLLKK